MLKFEQAKEKLEQTIKNLQSTSSRGLPTKQIINEAVESVRQEIKQEDKDKLEEFLSKRRLK